MKVIVRDRNGNIIPDDKLKETVITSELYYMYINSIRESLREEQKKKETQKTQMTTLCKTVLYEFFFRKLV